MKGLVSCGSYLAVQIDRGSCAGIVRCASGVSCSVAHTVTCTEKLAGNRNVLWCRALESCMGRRGEEEGPGALQGNTRTHRPTVVRGVELFLQTFEYIKHISDQMCNSKMF